LRDIASRAASIALRAAVESSLDVSAGTVADASAGAADDIAASGIGVLSRGGHHFILFADDRQ
jgi:hypothetical protein